MSSLDCRPSLLSLLSIPELQAFRQPYLVATQMFSPLPPLLLPPLLQLFTPVFLPLSHTLDPPSALASQASLPALWGLVILGSQVLLGPALLLAARCCPTLSGCRGPPPQWQQYPPSRQQWQQQQQQLALPPHQSCQDLLQHSAPISTLRWSHRLAWLLAFSLQGMLHFLDSYHSQGFMDSPRAHHQPLCLDYSIQLCSQRYCRHIQPLLWKAIQHNPMALLTTLQHQGRHLPCSLVFILNLGGSNHHHHYYLPEITHLNYPWIKQ